MKNHNLHTVTVLEGDLILGIVCAGFTCSLLMAVGLVIVCMTSGVLFTDGGATGLETLTSSSSLEDDDSDSEPLDVSVPLLLSAADSIL